MKLELMLRTYFLQHWFNLSDPGAEDALYDSESMRRFAGVTLGEDKIPDETTILHFRHLLERHDLTDAILEGTDAFLKEKGIVLRRGTIVDATMIAAPTSTRNQEGKRDPEMRSTQKGNQWYFGMKIHVGTDVQGLVHSLVATDAAQADIHQLPGLIHGEETELYGDSAYRSESDRNSFESAEVAYCIHNRAYRNTPLTASEKEINRQFSRVRSRVEHVFRVVKHLWGHGKVRYRGIAKNRAHFCTTFALANLYLVRKRLAAA
jgi:IS5 family transposase